VIPKYLLRKGRRLWHRLFPEPITLVYHPRYDAAFPNVPNDPLRAERILAFLAAEGLVVSRNLREPRPASLKELGQIHGEDYLDSLREDETVCRILGCEILGEQVDRVLDLQRLQAGGTVLAARLARPGHPLAVNLGGGFHHAHANQGGGFCIFNDVAVAIAERRRRGFKGHVLVVDLDLHDGDGTRGLFAQDETVHTFSIHGRHWGPTEAVESTAIELGVGVENEAYLEALREHLPPVVERFKPRLAFYLAGCDPAHDDRLGDWKISKRGLLERDRFVISQLHSGSRKVPVAMVLAGGYSPRAWRYTARFLSDYLTHGEPIEPPSTEVITLKRYRYISSLLPSGELSGASSENEFGLTEEDLFLPGWGGRKETRFLGFYTKHGLELIFERTGVLDRLRDLGFEHPTVELDLDDPAGQTLRVFGDPRREEVLVELRVRRDRRTIPEMELLSIDWLLLQNPRSEFSPTRPRLPGQQFPGLGMLKDVVAMLIVACERLHLDGLVFVPSKYHIANQLHGGLFFLERDALARYNALAEALPGMTLVEASQAIDRGRVIDETTGEAIKWKPETMILPVSEELMGEFGRRAKTETGTGGYRFRLLGEGETPPAAKRHLRSA